MSQEDAEQRLWQHLEAARMQLEYATYVHMGDGQRPLPAFGELAAYLEKQLKAITVPLGKVVMHRIEMQPPATFTAEALVEYQRICEAGPLKPWDRHPA